MDLIEEYKFKNRSTCLIAGLAKSGKTTLHNIFLINNEQMISHPIDNSLLLFKMAGCIRLFTKFYFY